MTPIFAKIFSPESRMTPSHLSLPTGSDKADDYLSFLLGARFTQRALPRKPVTSQLVRTSEPNFSNSALAGVSNSPRPHPANPISMEERPTRRRKKRTRAVADTSSQKKTKTLPLLQFRTHHI